MFCKSVTLNGTSTEKKILHKYYTTGYISAGRESYQIFVGNNHSLYPSTFIQNKIFSNRTLLRYLTKHTYPINSAFVYLVCFHSQSKLRLIILMALFSVQFSALNNYFSVSILI